MDDIYWEFAPLFLIAAALFGLGYWWNRRSNRKEERGHGEALAAFAGSLGGRVVGPAEAVAWSSQLLPPMKSHTEGFVGRVGTVRPPRFDTALDFRRGRWSVRVSEASMEKANSSSSATIHEYRIEVATSTLVPMKISRRIHVGLHGRKLAPDHILAQGGTPVREAPVTVAREQRQWLQARLPESLDRDFVLFTTDPIAAARAFNPQVVEWLLGQAGDHPVTAAMPLMLTFEAGLVYTTTPQRIDPDRILARVDAMLGLLDRMGVTPGSPPR
ncbi:hypothetical protein ACFXGA_03155 [Actinosynnema sp. NPDC059335]|uniref:hypothetical protein n=1 Tax=Actinosynnema sp. NPDC059335 TaxID=3346804 RepID=UPI0036709EF3